MEFCYRESYLDGYNITLHNTLLAGITTILDDEIKNGLQLYYYDIVHHAGVFTNNWPLTKVK